ncbi:MAG TPA: Uma2 family endonuclease [Pyrinomonadaceae bacterium]|jgi:Uma2 family endonuclease|nr:Uma2 family endonuclease [Pyrinomonadaceae bacterium]
MSSQAHPSLTVADLDVMPENGDSYELIEGDLYVSRAPHIVHQAVLGNLLYAVRTYLRDNPIGKILPEIGVFLSEHDAVIPDLAYISGDRFYQIISGGKLTDAPDLVVEILSSGVENERRDRNVKRYLYGKYGVKEYWIINWEAGTVEIYQLAANGLELQATLGTQDELTTTLLPGFSCRVESIFEV